MASLKPGQMVVTAVIDINLSARLQRMGYGVRTRVLRKLLNDMADAYDKQGPLILGAILGGQYEWTLKLEDKNAPGTANNSLPPKE